MSVSGSSFEDASPTSSVFTPDGFTTSRVANISDSKSPTELRSPATNSKIFVASPKQAGNSVFDCGTVQLQKSNSSGGSRSSSDQEGRLISTTSPSNETFPQMPSAMYVKENVSVFKTAGNGFSNGASPTDENVVEVGVWNVPETQGSWNWVSSNKESGEDANNGFDWNQTATAGATLNGVVNQIGGGVSKGRIPTTAGVSTYGNQSTREGGGVSTYGVQSTGGGGVLTPGNQSASYVISKEHAGFQIKKADSIGSIKTATNQDSNGLPDMTRENPDPSIEGLNMSGACGRRASVESPYLMPNRRENSQTAPPDPLPEITTRTEVMSLNLPKPNGITSTTRRVGQYEENSIVQCSRYLIRPRPCPPQQLPYRLHRTISVPPRLFGCITPLRLVNRSINFRRRPSNRWTARMEPVFKTVYTRTVLV